MRFFLKYFTGFCLAIFASIAAGNTALNAQQSSSSVTPLYSSATVPGAISSKPRENTVTYEHSTVRLIAGDYRNKTWTAGVEIILAPGWKTYWRVPGDSGVPAEFEWKNSTNVKTAEVSWPAPKRYQDITGKSIGYKKHVIFPVTVTPENNSRPARLDLQLYYAVCSDICVPAQASLKLDLPVDMPPGMDLPRINKFLALVPQKLESAITVVDSKVIIIKAKPVLTIKLSGKVAKKTDILVEGSDAAFFDAPKAISSTNGEHVFHLPIDGIDKPGQLAGKVLKLTVLSGDIRFEKNIRLK